MPRANLRLLAATGFLVLAAAGNAELFGLSSSAPGTVYRVDAATGAATAAFNLSGSLVAVSGGLEFLNGTLYASNILVGSDYTFGSIDLNTGAYTPLNAQGGNDFWDGLAANQSANLLYSVDGGGPAILRTISPNGVIATVGPVNEEIAGLAYDDAAGILYGVDAARLFRIDTATGAATLVGPLGFAANFKGLAFDADRRTLYLNTGFGQGENGNRLFAVDTVTGAATLVGANGPTASFGIDALAWRNPVPEPASALAILGGLAALAIRRRRR